MCDTAHAHSTYLKISSTLGLQALWKLGSLFLFFVA